MKSPILEEARRLRAEGKFFSEVERLWTAADAVFDDRTASRALSGHAWRLLDSYLVLLREASSVRAIR